MAKDGMVAGERESERKTEGGNEGKIVLYKAEVVFVSGRLTLFPHRLSKLL